MRPPHWALRLYAEYLHRQAVAAHRAPGQTQAALLSRLLARYAPTALGRELGLAGVKSPADYVRAVPVTTDATYQPFMERVLAENPPDWVAPGRLKYVVRTTGTTKVSKFVPYPLEMIAGFKRFETKLALHTMRTLKTYSMLDSNVLITAGMPTFDTSPCGVTVASPAGLMAVNPPKLGKDIVRPTPDILAIPDWQAKIRATVEQALPLDIRVMTGIPVFVPPILERLLERAAETGRPAANARELWPNLSAYYWSGSFIGQYEARLRELFGPGVPFIEIYSATEAPVAYQYRPGEPGLLLDLENAYFEFQPVEAPLDSPRVGVEGVETGVRYRILVTNLGGLFSYRLGDVVEFLAREPLLMRVVGRETDELNLAGERVQLHVLRAGLMRVAEQFGVHVRNFFVAPPPPGASGPTAYHVTAEFEPEVPNLAAFAAALDAALIEDHNYYRLIRSNDTVFGPPVVSALPPGTIDRYVLETRAFGLGKFVHLYGDRTVPDQILQSAAARA